MSTDLVKYYNKRAREYERIYSKPERQQDIEASVKILQRVFEKKEVLEIACGTGFWTQYIAQSASSILATDINPPVIEIAKAKRIEHPDLNFEERDIYTFRPQKRYESLFGGFIWSHVLKQDLAHFYKTIHAMLKPGAWVVLMDNTYVEGSNHPITSKDAEGNTFQTRMLDDGSTYEVLKNFATEETFKETLKDQAEDFKFISLRYFWIAIYKTKK